jgi:hypothetical protein
MGISLQLVNGNQPQGRELDDKKPGFLSLRIPHHRSPSILIQNH